MTQFFPHDKMILYENFKLNRTPQYDLPDLRGRQIFADPPAMRGTSGQVYTDNIIIYNLKNFLICVHLCPKKENAGQTQGTIKENHGN